MTFDELSDALGASRIPWQRIIDSGHCLHEIADSARSHGDEGVYQRAKRAAARRGI